MKRTLVCNRDRLNVERVMARLFALGGGAFWTIAAFAAEYGFRDQGLFASVGSASIPLSITVLVFVVGWFNEALAAGMLTVGVLAMVVWGVSFGWEPNLWALMSVFFIGPMVVAGVLYGLAHRMQRVCDNPRAVGTLASAGGHDGLA